MSIKKEAREIKDYMVEVRRNLHKIPEISLNLPKTVEIVSKELQDLEIEHKVYKDISCVFATIGQGSPCILLRADMDGLPGMEESKLDFSAEKNMHACGHDMHAASLLGCAKILKNHESELKGTVKLLFQSAEETFLGAKASIDAGILENPKPDVAYASHVFSLVPENIVMTGKKPMASAYMFKIIVKGKGGHGSQPDKCIDPINALTQIYTAFQSLIAREIPAGEEAVLTIGEFRAGEAANVIPEEGYIRGTLRTFNPEIRNFLIERINEVAQDVAKTYRCEAKVVVEGDVPPLHNDEKFMTFCIDTIKKEGLAENIDTSLHVSGSEDFALISEKIPSCYFVVGAAPEEKEYSLVQHNPKIRFNENALVRSSAMYAQIAISYLNK